MNNQTTRAPRTASALQARRAFEKHFGKPMLPGMTYQDAAMDLVASMGEEAAWQFITSMDNDPRNPD